MATISAYASWIKPSSSGGTWSNISNVTDTDESSYGSVKINWRESHDFAVGGFDFTSIPAGSTINSVTFSTKAGTDSNIEYKIYGTRKYTNGSFSDKVVTNSTIIQPGKLETYSTSSQSLLGSWTADELRINSSNPQSTYYGIGILLRGYNNGFTSKSLHVRYVKITVDYTPPSYSISTTVSPSGSGTITGGGQYEVNSSVTLTAVPSTGYHFVQWQDGNTSNPRTITVSGDATYTATFAPNSYSISTAVSPSGSGSVSGAGTYNHGSTATLTATPATGYEFVKWSDNNTSSSRTVTVTAAATYTATFQLKTYTIYLTDDDGNSLGSVTATHGSSPVITTTPTKQPSGGATYTFREWNTQRDGSGTAYPLNGLPAATGSTTYFAQFDATYSEPDIASITVAPNPATGGQGVVITVTFST